MACLWSSQFFNSREIFKVFKLNNNVFETATRAALQVRVGAFHFKGEIGHEIFGFNSDDLFPSVLRIRDPGPFLTPGSGIRDVE